MKHTFTREQIKRIILEELKNSKVKDAAEEIVDDLGDLTEGEGDSFFKKLFSKIFQKSKEDNIDEEGLAVETWKELKSRTKYKNIVAGITLASFLGGLQANIDMQQQMGAQAKAATKTTQQALKSIEKQNTEDAIKQLNDKLSISVLYTWSVDSAKDSGASGEFITGTQQNFPLFQDYNYGTVQIFSPEYGVVVKLKNDIQKQIDQGVINKKDLKPMISDVKDPSMSKQEFAEIYKELYGIPDFDPANVSKDDIGGNIDNVTKITKGGMKFLKGKKGSAYGYESYELSDFVNAELPNNPGLSPSQFYMKLFNEVTGQNINP